MGLFNWKAKEDGIFYKEKIQILPTSSDYAMCYASARGALNDRIGEIKSLGDKALSERRDLYLFINPKKGNSKIKVIQGEALINSVMAQLENQTSNNVGNVAENLEFIAQVLYCGNKEDIQRLQSWVKNGMKDVDHDIYSSIEGKTLNSDEFGNYLIDKHYYKQMESWTTAIIDYATDNVHTYSLD